MKKLIFILMLLVAFVAIKAQVIPSGVSGYQLRTNVNNAFSAHDDSITSLRYATNQNYGFISSLDDSISEINDSVVNFNNYISNINDSIPVLRGLIETTVNMDYDTIDYLDNRVDSSNINISSLQDSIPVLRSLIGSGGSGSMDYDTIDYVNTRIDSITLSSVEAGSIVYKDSTDYPQLPTGLDTTYYLNATNNWSVPVSGGGGSSVSVMYFTNANAKGDTTITHGDFYGKVLDVAADSNFIMIGNTSIVPSAITFTDSTLTYGTGFSSVINVVYIRDSVDLIVPRNLLNPLVANTVAYYAFEETSGVITDATDSANDATSSTITTYSETGIVNNAITQAASDGSEVPVWTSFSRPLSYSVWINVPGAVTGTQYIVGWSNAGGPALAITSTQLQFIRQRQANVCDYNFVPTASTWYHIVFTYDASGNYAFYVNGSSVKTGTSNDASINYDLDLRVGSRDFHTESFIGTMDELGIFNKVLSPTEVTELYNSGSGLTFPF